MAKVVPFMLKINAGAYSFEVANPRHQHEYKIWEDLELPDDRVLIPGLIGHANNYVEHEDLIAEYIVRYANIVGKERVIAGADCGFSSRGQLQARGPPDGRLAEVQAPRNGRRDRHEATLDANVA